MNLAELLVNSLIGHIVPPARPQGPGLNIGEVKTRKAVGLPTTARMTQHATSKGDGSGKRAVVAHEKKFGPSPQKTRQLVDTALHGPKKQKTEKPKPREYSGSPFNPLSEKFAHNFLKAEDATIGNFLGMPDGLFAGEKFPSYDEFDKSDIALQTALTLGLGPLTRGISKGAKAYKASRELPTVAGPVQNGFTSKPFDQAVYGG